MATIYDVDPNKLIAKAAEELAKSEHVKAPVWAQFVKTGTHKQRLPAQKNWWHIRAASVLRTIYLNGPIGVSKLRTRYGGNKRRGYKPAEFRKASGKIIRLILQQLDKEGLTKYAEKGVHKGRVITPKGKSFLDKMIRRK